MIKGDKLESLEFKTACIYIFTVIVILIIVLVLRLRTQKGAQHLTIVLCRSYMFHSFCSSKAIETADKVF